MKTHNLQTWSAFVGIRQGVRDRAECQVLLELPARGENAGPYSMSPEDAIKLANKIRKMAKAAQA
jgi:hypothetical protein